jgi:hypothetical protein
MSKTEYSMFNVETIFPTGDFEMEPIWKLKVGSHLLTGQSTYSFDSKGQNLTLDLSFKIPMSNLLEQVKPVMQNGVNDMDLNGAKAPMFPWNGCVKGAKY